MYQARQTAEELQQTSGSDFLMGLGHTIGSILQQFGGVDLNQVGDLRRQSYWASSELRPLVAYQS